MNSKWISALSMAAVLLMGAARASAGEWIDTGTQCFGMHCCPDGSAMTGEHTDRNFLLCSNDISFSGVRYEDYYTQCWNDADQVFYHCCPNGDVMVGVHVSNNILICQHPATGTRASYNDNGGATQRDGMHACWPGFFMGGIHDSRNDFFCEQRY
jgi:hypothetical protein